MAQSKGGGSGPIIFILLLLILLGLYQCYGGKYGLPVVKGLPTAQSLASSESSSTSLAPADELTLASASATASEAASDSASASDSAPASASSSDSSSSSSSVAVIPTGLTYPACTTINSANGFSYCAPGNVIANSMPPGATSSYNQVNAWALDSLAYGSSSVLTKAVCFPLADSAYANSQYFNPGGQGYISAWGKALPAAQLASLRAQDAAGTITIPNYNKLHDLETAPSNYMYPWRDTFCEYRGYSQANSLCNGGNGGHQGQDIRPASLSKNTYWAVAAEDGVIYETSADTQWNASHGIPRYWLKIKSTGEPSRYYSYLHMLQVGTAKTLYAQHPAQYPQLHNYPDWKAGDVVHAGQKLGLVSTYFGAANTSTHLHFEIRLVLAQKVNGVQLGQTAPIPPYLTLVNAYKRKLNGTGCATS